MLVTWSCLTLTSWAVHGILQARVLEWVGFRFLLQEIFPTQGWNPGLLHCRRILYRLTTREAQIEIHRLGFFLSLSVPWRASLVAQLIKNLPAMRETWVWSLGWEDPLERLPLQYSAVENSMDCIVHGVTKSQTWLRTFTFTFKCPMKTVWKF